MFGIKSGVYCNFQMKTLMKETEIFLLWLYSFGSKYETPFWKYAKSLPFNPDPKFYEVCNDSSNDDVYGQFLHYDFNIFKKYC